MEPAFLFKLAAFQNFRDIFCRPIAHYMNLSLRQFYSSFLPLIIKTTIFTTCFEAFPFRGGGSQRSTEKFSAVL